MKLSHSLSVLTLATFFFQMIPHFLPTRIIRRADETFQTAIYGFAVLLSSSMALSVPASPARAKRGESLGIYALFLLCENFSSPLKHFPGHFFLLHPSRNKTSLRPRTGKKSFPAAFFPLALLIRRATDFSFHCSAKPNFSRNFLSLKRKWNRFFPLLFSYSKKFLINQQFFVHNINFYCLQFVLFAIFHLGSLS